jgi:hypothetical protein
MTIPGFDALSDFGLERARNFTIEFITHGLIPDSEPVTGKEEAPPG